MFRLIGGTERDLFYAERSAHPEDQESRNQTDRRAGKGKIVRTLRLSNDHIDDAAHRTGDAQNQQKQSRMRDTVRNLILMFPGDLFSGGVHPPGSRKEEIYRQKQECLRQSEIKLLKVFAGKEHGKHNRNCSQDIQPDQQPEKLPDFFRAVCQQVVVPAVDRAVTKLTAAVQIGLNAIVFRILP